MTYQEWEQHYQQLEQELIVLQNDCDVKKLSYMNAKDSLEAKEKEIKDWKKVKIDDYKLPEGVTLQLGDVIQFTEKVDKWDIKKDDRFIIILGTLAWQDYRAQEFNNDILGTKKITFCFEKYSNPSNYIDPAILNYIKTMQYQFV